MNIVFLCSGNGGNMKFIHVINNKFPVRVNLNISGVICDRDCGALEYAKKNNILTKKHSFKRDSQSNNELIEILKKMNGDIVITNVHRIISKEVLDAFSTKFLNVHYSILPAFAGTIGMDTVDAAIEKGCKFLGSTSHEVSEDVDAGPIKSQAVFPNLEQENVYDLIFKCGCLSLLSGLIEEKVYEEKIYRFMDILVNPSIPFKEQELIEVFDKVSSI